MNFVLGMASRLCPPAGKTSGLARQILRRLEAEASVRHGIGQAISGGGSGCGRVAQVVTAGSRGRN